MTELMRSIAGVASVHVLPPPFGTLMIIASSARSGRGWPRVPPSLREVADHSVFRSQWSSQANAVEGQVNVIRDAVVTKRKHVVALHEVFGIWSRHSLTRLAAVEGD